MNLPNDVARCDGVQYDGEWLMRKLGDESQVWHDKSASVAVHHPIEIYNDH